MGVGERRRPSARALSLLLRRVLARPVHYLHNLLIVLTHLFNFHRFLFAYSNSTWHWSEMTEPELVL